MYRFVVESTLGRLGKWLRLIGFDTAMVKGRPDPCTFHRLMVRQQRVVLTRTTAVAKSLTVHRCIWIKANAPLDQMRFLVLRLGIDRSVLKPLSRCVICNVPVVPIGKDQLSGRVPDHVVRHQNQFATCKVCRRIYWPGTHQQRCQQLIDRFFQED